MRRGCLHLHFQKHLKDDRLHSTLEVLERIAPAAVSVTYTDVDGDLVKVTTSTGNLSLADLHLVARG